MTEQGELDFGDLLDEDDVHEEMLKDLRRLKQAWINEKVCPELLPFEHEVVENMSEQIENQALSIEDGAKENINNAFIANLYEMELERLRFILRSYLRVRLWKIEKNITYILSNLEQRRCLSPAEESYAKNYKGNVDTHFHDCCLQDLPERIRNLNEQSEEVDMIPKPNVDAYVFCKVMEDVGQFVFEETAEGEILEGELAKDDRYIIRYSAIKPLLKESKIALL
eukprot:Nk52_evm73s352 gene=Nk52_evmTU73s352